MMVCGPYVVCSFLLWRRSRQSSHSVSFFFNDTATTEIYTLSLHDALPICFPYFSCVAQLHIVRPDSSPTDRKSTRLNSSHRCISYAVFCLKNIKINSL